MTQALSTPGESLTRMRGFLNRMTVAALATADSAGLPYAVSLYMASDTEARLYFASDPRAHHCRHVSRQPNVHVAAYAPNAPWTQARGIQVGGTCEKVPDGKRGEIARIYCRRFPFAADVLERVNAVSFYCITPSVIRWIDNRVRFGFKVDFTWPLPHPSSADHWGHGG